MNTYPSRKLSTKTIVAIALAATTVFVLFAIYFYKVNPESGPSLKCAFKAFTGYDCPGCGSQRAFHAIMHLEFAKAWHFNPFVFFAVPATIFYFIVETILPRKGAVYRLATHPITLSAILFAIIAWWIIRNLF